MRRAAPSWLRTAFLLTGAETIWGESPKVVTTLLCSPLSPLPSFGGLKTCLEFRGTPTLKEDMGLDTTKVVFGLKFFYALFYI